MEFCFRSTGDGVSSRWLHWRGLFLAFAILAHRVCGEDKNVRPAGRFINQIGEKNVKYQGLVASFGNKMNEDVKVNLMLPPDHTDDPYLCAYPQSLNTTNGGVDDTDIRMRASNISQPVALLVAVGGPCSTEDKARIMLQMQTNFSSYLKVLLLYETNQKYANWFISLAPDSAEPPPELDNVGIVYFPFRHLPRMKVQLNSVRKGNPMFLQPGNEAWSFEHSIEGFWMPIDPEDSKQNDFNGYEYNEGDDYYWIRYVLFSLLILSPCFRAGYLFYSGGGRVRFRRNEGGRIVGFQYIPPMPYWLSNGRIPQAQEPVSRALTEEQFESLPEIKYAPMPEEHVDEIEQMEESFDEAENKLIPSDPELGKSTIEEAVPGSKETNESDKEETDNEVETSTGDNELSAVVLVDDDHVSGPMHALCRWSECSICIDDFELDEVLTLLPKCQHVFHKDCIKPWLLERQGRCPLCKTSVLGDGDETDSERDSTVDGQSSDEAPTDGQATTERAANEQATNEQTTASQ